uniref:Uncharacterized protein n=1 Tax=Rhizophora mucronata TaxID=61149 RepID=A0A2P2M516_RHIMU
MIYLSTALTAHPSDLWCGGAETELPVECY